MRAMVRLYAVDVSALAPRFEALLPRVDERRRARVRSNGNTPEGRRILGAGLLLTLLADADALCAGLRTNAYGRPYLDGRPPFSLSHAGDYAVLATAEHAVGVDVERIRPIAHASIAKRFFHPEEQAYLDTSADPAGDFFTIWTLKESYLKAEGCGFARSLQTFALLPDQRDGAVPGWDTDYCFLRYFDLSPAYRLAACVRDEAFCPSVERITF